MSPKDQQNLRVIEQGNGNNGNGNGNGNNESLVLDKTKIPEHFFVDICGQRFIKYEGLLFLGRMKGLLKLTSEIIKYPQEGSPDCICLATLTGKNGEFFQDIGDANCSNVNAKVARHYIRVSSTRAKARCLRDYLGEEIQFVCIDELDEICETSVQNNVFQETEPKRRTRRRSTNKSKIDKSSNDSRSDISPGTTSNGGESEETPKGNKDTESRQSNNGGPKMSNAQRKAIENLSRRRRISMEDIDKMTLEMYNISFEHLSNFDASALIHQLQEPA